MLPPQPSDRAIVLGRVGMVTTVAAWLAYVVATVLTQFVDNGVESMRFASEAFSYALVVTVLSFSALMYLLARQGALYRFQGHVRVPRAEIDAHFDESLPTLTVLVPAYREDPRIVRKTLLSAALQEYPYMRVVLLLDDPPEPDDPDAAAQLRESRALTDGIRALLEEPRRHLSAALERFETATALAGEPTLEDVRVLAREYAWAAAWLDSLAESETALDHLDDFFVTQVLGGLSRDLSVVREALDDAVAHRGTLPRERVTQLYRRLVWTFRADLATFERKRYASLSQAPNKAMNLNSYIGLMGGRFDEVHTPLGTVLRPAALDGSVVVPDADYVLTLDADSLLLREYCLRLVHFMEQPENARVAVAQTPYSAFPGSRTRIERLAGATTDIQHMLHQGLTYFGATFWVGANAVLRKRALEDIVEVEHVGGFEHRRYIQDRTVIEDTESSIDLSAHGWTLFNYPERLSYSATPPDFGSLVVQRRRWADGGLLILPKFLRTRRERRLRGAGGGLGETMLRVNYMASIAWASFGLMLILAYPYDSRLLSPLVILAALPYFLAMSSDLKACGYKRTDVFRIYGFNIALLPVNMAGVLKSLQQAVTGQKIAFARTPKVRDRTATQLPYLVGPYLIVGLSLFAAWRESLAHNWANAAFGAMNAALAGYAIVAFIGLRNSLVDLCVGVLRWLHVERRPRTRPVEVASEAAAPVPVSARWDAVLYHGSADLPRHAPGGHPTAGVPAPRGGTAGAGPARALRTGVPTPRTVPAVPADAARSLAELIRAVSPDAEVELRVEGEQLTVRISRATTGTH